MEDAVEMGAPIGSRTPAHLWLTGILGTLWTAFGCYDYVMTQSKNMAYLEMMGGPEVIEYFTTFPGWVVAFWAVGVWGSLLGSLLLLVRRRLAVPVYGLSIAGLLVTSLYQFGISTPPPGMMTTGMWIMTVVVWVVAIGLFAYARIMAARGVLR